MITLVLPWFGPDSAGGAEAQARDLARTLRDLGYPVRVWASTGRDSFQPGDPGQPNGSRPHYPPGHGEAFGVPVWRFRPSPAGPDHLPRFFAERPELLPPLAGFASHELALLRSLLGSDELYAAIWAARDDADNRFVFLPYPFPTTFWGALLAPQRSYLLACLHDEPYARYATYRHMFGLARGMLANSHPEAELARALYGMPDARICVAGEGIDLTPRGDGARFRQRHGLGDTPLLLYAGRRDDGKNTPLLLAYAREYWARRGGALRLALMGAGALGLASAGHTPGLADLVLDLGFQGDQDKHDAYAAADVFIQPSLYESFSIVLMEAWLQRAPALVHSSCAVTADHARRSGGGLAFGSFGEFAAALDMLLARPDLRHALGERGRAYVLETCDWETVARRTAGFVLS
ncbi:glycosyltransferase family 4 protein [Oscillochloris sp. ZM17-4]|uniref:glycosyltransferase family 4 protein n=1 Tax=Oscillochloris sp. ZM17-4 TaxID=2866714 RepID=UPI001C7397B6|nr:glycosyltransferase family 4 protein [Oscillochloris sp. ZM17-4]MBX0326930.1 glycosyltransferase family 4 protein [Oscillochloris sp. ZM17-4]